MTNQDAARQVAGHLRNIADEIDDGALLNGVDAHSIRHRLKRAVAILAIIRRDLVETEIENGDC